SLFYFFQAEDGIRDRTVTGVQTCALPICLARTDGRRVPQLPSGRREVAGGAAAGGSGVHAEFDRSRDDGAHRRHAGPEGQLRGKIGRASCTERVWGGGGAVAGARKRE